jgi:hypothetical protein
MTKAGSNEPDLCAALISEIAISLESDSPQGGEMTQALYAHMNNKTIKIKKKKRKEKKVTHPRKLGLQPWPPTSRPEFWYENKKTLVDKYIFRLF